MSAALAPRVTQASEAFFRQRSWFLASAVSHKGLDRKQPEVAFVGRSNVGKSSLINAVLHQKGLVKTAKRPGHTTMLNFFSLDDQITLVDMPGYGYGSRRGYQQLVEGYLTSRAQLRRICLLIDARRGLMDIDEGFARFLNDGAVSFQIVLTKADAVESAVLAQRLGVLRDWVAQNTAACYPYIFATSSRYSLGLAELRASLYEATR